MLIVIGIIIILVNGQSQAWTDIQTGKVSPITTFSGDPSAATYTDNIAHTNAGGGLEACLSLISYNALLSTSFSFNTTIVSLTASNLQFSVQTYNTTYFNILSYHYLIHTHPTLEVHNLCYYTSSLYTGNGTRTTSFSNATTTFNGSFLTISTVISGLKV